MTDLPRIVLPDKFKAVQGDTLQLFYRGFIEHPFPYVYNIEVICDIGKNTPRYFEVTPAEEHMGEHTLTVNIRNCRDEILVSASSVIEVVPKHKAPEKVRSILCMGDSLSSMGVWCDELNRRLTATDGVPEGDGLCNLRFIGTKRVNDTCYEGYGGWTWTSYLTGPSDQAGEIWVYCSHNKDERDQHSLWTDENGGSWKIETVTERRIKLIRQEPFEELLPTSGRLIHSVNAVNTENIEYTDVQSANTNPFWNIDSASVDFPAYCKRNGFVGIDVVCVLLGWNAGGGYLDGAARENIARHVENAKRFLGILHSQYPDAKVMLMGLQLPGLNGGCGASYGAGGHMKAYSNTYVLCRYVFELNIAYRELAKSEELSSFVEYVDIASQFDSENNMPEEDKPVNLRSAKTEKVGTNGVHPKPEGYYQIADAVYRAMDLK